MALRKAPLPKDPVGSAAQTRIREIGDLQPLNPALRPTFPAQVLEELQRPTFDIWAWKEEELIYLMEAMLERFGLFDTFKIPRAKFLLFMKHVQYAYNANPFHNFKHCFCVTQMVGVGWVRACMRALGPGSLHAHPTTPPPRCTHMYPSPTLAQTRRCTPSCTSRGCMPS
jgi:hypothetical protein